MTTTHVARDQRPMTVIRHTELFAQLYSPFDKAAQLYAKNESENLTNQQHKTLKRYLAHIDDILCSRKPKIFAEIYIFYC